MKVLALETHWKETDVTTPVDWWRVVNPLSWLKKKTDWKIRIKKQFTGKDLIWADIIFSSYILEFRHFFSAKQLLINYNRNPVFVMDFDDNLSEIEDTNPFKKDIISKIHEVRAIVQAVDYVTTTTSVLKKIYRKFKAKGEVKTLPNMIDMSLFKPAKTDGKKITIFYFGTPTHFIDMNTIYPALKTILRKYSNVYLKCVCGIRGTQWDKLPKTEMEVGTSDFIKWVKRFNKEKFDIGIIPLADVPFNYYKSNIKWQEFSAKGVPVVASAVKPNMCIKHGETGFLARSENDWVKYLSLLIEKKSLRKKIGEQAKKEVAKNWSIQSGWKKYFDFFQSVLK